MKFKSIQINEVEMPSLEDFEGEIGKYTASFVITEDSYILEIIGENNLNLFITKMKQYGIDYATRNSSLKGRKNNQRLFWRLRDIIPDSGVPFVIDNIRRLECIVGPARKRGTQNSIHLNDHPRGEKKRLRLQPTKKQNCPASMKIIELTYYPEYTVPKSTINVRKTKEKKLKELMNALQDENIVVLKEIKFFVTLSKYHNHSALTSFLNQQLHVKLKEEVNKYVSEGITHIKTIQKLLRNYVKNEFSDEIPVSSRSFYPSQKTLYNYVSKYRASKIDQIATEQKMKFNENKNKSSVSDEGSSTTVVVPATEMLTSTESLSSNENLIQKIREQTKSLHDYSFLISSIADSNDLLLLSEKLTDLQLLMNKCVDIEKKQQYCY